MFPGQQPTISFPIPDSSTRSPSGSIDLSPNEDFSKPMEMNLRSNSRLPAEAMAMKFSGNGRPDSNWAEMFYYSSSDPWTPLNLSGSGPQQNHHIPTSNIQRGGNHAAFNGGWRSAQPSECGTHVQGYLPSDSGYESRPKHDDILSDYDDVDRGQDTQSITGHMHDMAFSIAPEPFVHGVHILQDQWAATPVSVANGGANDKQMKCPVCQAICKTKSELNKHNQRHRKAFKCNVPGCTRKDGFGTQNDLERHKTSVHRGLVKGGQEYLCNIDQCATKEKRWPRADNFRQHVKRVHGRVMSSDEDLSEFFIRPVEAQPVRTVQEDLEGVGSVPAFNTAPAGPWEQPEDIQLQDVDEFALDPSMINGAQAVPNITVGDSVMEMDVTDIHMSGQASSLGSMEDVHLHPPYSQIQNQHEFVQPREISKPAPSMNAEGRTGFRTTGLGSTQSSSIIGLTNGTRGDDSSRPEHASLEASRDSLKCQMDCGSPPESTAFESKSGQENPGMRQPLSASNSSLEKSGEQEVRRLLDTLPKHLIEKYLKETVETAAKRSTPPPTNNTSTMHQCRIEGCQKGFARNCELKKHMKRHAKPYGCTYPTCKKKFGSKNDWKRHENSQHFQVEVWKCDEKRTEDVGNSSQTCGKACHRRETFRNHLQKEHMIEDSSRIDEALERCRFGRTCDTRFWCGFCVSLIETTKKGNNAKGNNAWNERFDHIDAHYSGRDNTVKRDISEWKNVDTDLPDMDLTASADDSSDAESEDEAAISPLDSSGSATHGESRKRGPVDDGEQPSRKRTKHQAKVQRWSCCNCQMDDGDPKLHVGCTVCNHKRCGDCALTETWIRQL